MPLTTDAAEKILNRVKGLRAQMQAGEEPILALPAIWDGGQSRNSTPCDVIVTNQRVLGYYYRGFPRERIFVDSVELSQLRTVTWRDKSYEPVFREIMMSNGLRTIYVRTPRQKSEQLYQTLRTLTEKNEHWREHPDALASEPTQGASTPASVYTSANEPAQVQQQPGPVYTRETVRRPFENSSLAAVLLLVGGVILEIGSLLLLFTTHSSSISVPLFIAGFVAVAASYVARRPKKSS